MRTLTLITITLLLSSLAHSQETQRQYLSGRDKDSAVNWEFLCTAGRNSGTWTTLPVPSNWEFHGFGNYTYGRDNRSKPVDEGKYRHLFTVPADWAGRRIFIVFDGSMTDTQVLINGQSAGPKHQGAFYRFKYDITKLLKRNEPNLLEVTVSKLSTDESVNRAERQSDYWIFGGIFRPVYLEATPQQYLSRTAIDARADGALSVDVFPAGLTSADSIEAQVLTTSGQPVGASLSSALKPGDNRLRLQGRFANIRTWTSETPNLYQLEVRLKQGNQVIHKLKQTFGFRTVEVRPGDGIYVNGQRVILKGVCRHSFWPDSGRTLNSNIHKLDIALIKQMNMNAVRMSHYPPDEEFLDLCDSLGLYVLDELGGWQKSYATEVGRKLVEETVTRDVNHPSILFWDNGNEGGWNRALDDEFAKWDPQNRNVLHPWELFRNVNTKHYPVYSYIQTALAGPNLYMPTEFLHALYDGGGAAGLADYWDLMKHSKVAAGGFIWALVDEGAVRTDRNGEIDTAGNAAPDGVLGPYRQKEASFFAIKEIWSPITLSAGTTPGSVLPDNFDGALTVENGYHFTDLKDCRFHWETRKLSGPTGTRPAVLAQGTLQSPFLAPGRSGKLQLNLPPNWRTGADALAIRVDDPNGQEIWTFVYPLRTPAQSRADLVSLQGPAPAAASEDAQTITLRAADTTIQISKQSGQITSASRAGKPLPLANGPRPVVGDAALSSIQLRQQGDTQIVEAQYTGGMKSATYTLYPSGWLRLDYEYAATGPQPYLGITFDCPESTMKSARWLGQGPYRVWKNRLAGTTLGIWENAYNDTLTGRKTWVYPEFRGYFAGMHWLKLTTAAGPITIATDTDNLFFRLLSEPKIEDKRASAVNAAPIYPPGNLSFLHAIPPIGNKFHRADQVGPQSQLNQASGPCRATLYFRFGS